MNLQSITAAFLACVPFCAHAVYLNPQGTGQALIYPYYTTQTVAGSAMNTYLSIVNQAHTHKALRIRVREGRNGREVASINVLLPFADTWTAALVPTAQGARLITRDKSCTDPAMGIGDSGESFIDLSNSAFSGSLSDAMGDDVERLREGYVEVLEMASIETSETTRLDCDAFRRGQFVFTGPDSTVSGTLTLINVANGMEFSTNATALASLSRGPLFRTAGDPYPDFDAQEVSPVAGFIIEGKMYRATTPTGLAAVEAVLTKQTIANEIVLDAATRSGTDWVVTMPTRRFHSSPSPGDPFLGAFVPGTRDVEASLMTFSREVTPVADIRNGCDGTCLPGQSSADLRMPWASTVWTFKSGTSASASKGTTDVLGARNGWLVTLPTAAENGWGSLMFGHAGLRVPFVNFNASDVNLADGATESGSFRLVGLPAVGFMARTFHNGFLNCAGSVCQGNYGGLFEHKWQPLIGRVP